VVVVLFYDGIDDWCCYKLFEVIIPTQKQEDKLDLIFNLRFGEILSNGW
jgi:hypothetical protein